MISYRYQVFLAVAKHLSFSKASENLYISQPAVSKQVKLLEAELGFALFQRRGNSVSLTAVGDILLVKLKQAKAIQTEFQSYLDTMRHNLEIKGEAKIGASTTVSLYVMPKILAALHQDVPAAEFLLINRNNENILKALDSEEIDLACIESFPQMASYHTEPFLKDEIIPVSSPKSTLQSQFTIEELLKLPMAFRERGSGTLAVVLKSFEALGVQPGDFQVIARLGGTEALKNYLIEGKAVGFLSRLAVKKELISGELVELQVNGLTMNREFNFVMRKGEERIGLIKLLIKKAKNLYNYK
ncbi:DNA-binding transcriptional LysR family regulator [Algoriphagus ratkowskyi]|uniref:DNA-binding transcriptional LysR family regulator n=1 Tax=Algoriphagus ratkowskyi TaxID=57028 RepID=A0A2W7SGV9_9BACT|nr:LysR family transcriptional regulator [Algoriphagus ratkowskyi]PZX49972.1 DNA-binding transcriptional LysR family regulator [Algoriphagus ratkowskyi]TXD75542.1 LysR family transcriptional regulator [Algoriphagus ratkowskyi]